MLDAALGERAWSGLRALRNSRRVTFSESPVQLKVTFSGTASQFDASRISAFAMALERFVFAGPSLDAIESGCLKVTYGFNDLGLQNRELLVKFIKSSYVAKLSQKLGIFKIQFGKTFIHFDVCMSVESSGRTLKRGHL